MASESFEVKGLKELSHKLRTMPDKVGKRHMRAAVAEGGKVVLYTAIATVDANSRITGTLSNAIAVSVSTRKRRNTLMNATANIGVKRGATASIGRGPRPKVYEYWKAIEFGNSRTPAEPFLRPAFETKKHQVLKFIIRRLQKGVEQEAVKKT